MILRGTTSVATDRAVVWRALTDPMSLAGALPGVDRVSQIDADTVHATVGPDLGLGLSPLQMRLWLTERSEPEHLLVHGHGTGAEYVLDLTAELDLTGDGSDTALTWWVDARFGGVLVSVGQRVLAPLVQAQLEQIAARFAEVVAHGTHR